MNKMPSAQELSDESLNAVAGGAGSWTPSFLFKPGDKVKFTHADNSFLYSDGVVQNRYLKTYNGQTIPHYTITVNHYTGKITYRDVPQHRIRFTLFSYSALDGK